MNEDEYSDLVKKTYKLIIDEMRMSETGDWAHYFPNLMVMYEFFRMLRGEAFNETRPSVPEKQQEFYRMEEKIRQALEELSKRVDFEDERLKYEMGMI